MSNKKDGHLDFRKVENTRFDSTQTSKMKFSEIQSSKRIYSTNVDIKDSYTRFTQVLDDNNRPTQVTYYQATKPTIDKLQFIADSGGSLAGEYYVIPNQIDGKTYAIYQVVSGYGSDPNIADVEIPATYNASDSTALVSFTNKIALEQIPSIEVKTQALMTTFNIKEQ